MRLRAPKAGGTKIKDLSDRLPMELLSQRITPQKRRQDRRIPELARLLLRGLGLGGWRQNPIEAQINGLGTVMVVPAIA